MPHRPTPKRGADALKQAQRIAFGPVVFQVARALRDLGVLARLEQAHPAAVSTEELLDDTALSRNGLLCLLEAGVSFDLVTENGGWVITDTGRFLQKDARSRLNLDFVQDVCWHGLAALPESVRDAAPRGLAALGPWSTFYEGLSQLPEGVRSSWLDFDHFYSDSAFPAAWAKVAERGPRRLLDVGGNTGRFATFAAGRDPDLAITLLDLPAQVELARPRLEATGLGSRVQLRGADLLDPTVAFPGAQDAVWMSQFLVCFDLDVVQHLLRRGQRALADGGSLWILDTFPDRQRSDIAAYCLHGTSPYFVAIASGNSRIYPFSELEPVIAAAGLRVAEVHEPLGISHSLVRCVPA